jgi:methylmalonyl-CoA mutase
MINLFKDFTPLTAQQWKQQIQYELKGSDYADLIWESPEGIKVKPFYDRDDVGKTFSAGSNTSFAICQEIFVQDVEKSSRRAQKSISKGAEEIRFILPKEVDLTTLLLGISEETTVYLELRFLAADYILANQTLLKKRKIYLLWDPIQHLVTQGNWFKDQDDLKNLAALSKNGLAVFCADGRPYQNAGANITQQIAYTVAHVAEIFQNCDGNHNDFIIQVAVGSNYFFEIAKLRALRLLFNAVAAAFNHKGNCRIIAVPTRRNKTIYDYNVNMLRTTTECMSAVLGGANVVQNMPYDALYHKSNEFGERIARNQLLILKNESYFDKINNAADGSFYIESLTNQLSSLSLDLFKKIEASGGFLKLLYDGTIQRKISESAQKEQLLFDEGKEILVGTSKYTNKADLMKDELECYPFLKYKPIKTTVVPILERRLAEKIEQERLNIEKA